MGSLVQRCYITLLEIHISKRVHLNHGDDDDISWRRFVLSPSFTTFSPQRTCKSTTLLFLAPSSFRFHVCQRRCPCTMVHVISGEWSSPVRVHQLFHSAPLPFAPPPPSSNSFSTFSSLSCAFPQTQLEGGHNDVGDSSLFHATVKAKQKPWQKRTGAIL